MARKARRFEAMMIGAKPIPIVQNIARQMDPSGADLTRFNDGNHPLLLNHTHGFQMQYGRILSAKATTKGIEGEVEIFGYDDEMAEPLRLERERVHQMIDDGMRNLSVGTKVYEVDEIETPLGYVYRATSWEPDELSLVAVGASRAARLTKELNDE